MSLKQYHAKRDFKITAEPKGKIISKKNSKTIFVIQKHAASHLHYDFRLELNGILLSWAVPKGPCLDPAVKRLAMHVEDHPLQYGNFEGTIPEGEYGRGTVMLWDKGTWHPFDENPNKAYQRGNLSFSLVGKKLQGKWKLIRINRDDKTWLLIKVKDKFSKAIKKYDVLQEEPYSVLTKKSMDEITKSSHRTWHSNHTSKYTATKSPKRNKKFFPLKINLPKAPFPVFVSPELATLVDKPPTSKNWLHEIKWDGYRIIAIKKNKRTKLFTRNQNDWTLVFSNIAAAINALPIDNLILDGEIVILDEKLKSNFQLLQNSIKTSNFKNFLYYLFDILYCDQYDVTTLPLIERKKILKQVLEYNSENLLQYSDHFLEFGPTVFKKACRLGFEGIISKDRHSLYTQKRGKDWLKSKCTKRQEFVIGGFTRPKSNRKYFGALLLGTFNKKGELLYHGNVGTGFSEVSLKTIYDELKKIIIPTRPFKTKPPGLIHTTWVEPVLVAEVEFQEWTKGEHLRHPSFKGLRKDKSPRTIQKEQETKIATLSSQKKANNRSVYPLTHPEKILYPEDKITKQDLFNYYEEISSWILPFIIKRPLALVRCPDGYRQECFFQKHVTQSTPKSLHSVLITEKHQKGKNIYIEDKDGLLALTQIGTLEIHPWNSRIEDIEHPDIIIFDLDPGPNVLWKEVVATAKEFKKRLESFHLKSFVKTTGGKGLHVVIPIKPEFTWESIKDFSHTFINYIAMEYPEKYVSKMTKKDRVNKIYLDYLRNQRGATAVAPYSTRAREKAPIATPIAWDELSHNFKDNFYTIKTILNRLKHLKKDPWQDFFRTKQSLKAALKSR